MFNTEDVEYKVYYKSRMFDFDGFFYTEPYSTYEAAKATANDFKNEGDITECHIVKHTVRKELIE